MKHVKKSVLLWYSPTEMYTLVIGVQDYPRFLPWCERTEVLQEHADGMTVRLHLAMGGLHHAFTTRNLHVRDQSVEVDLIDGPFSKLDGLWKFIALAKPGGEEAKACRIEFDLQYEFANSAFEAVLSPVFDRVANTLVDSFVKRAEQVYGPR